MSDTPIEHTTHNHPSHAHIGVAYLTITCSKCHMIYRAYHVSPDHGRIHFCMYCGTTDNNLTTRIEPEWDVIETLARAYHCSSRKVELALSIWQQDVHESLSNHQPYMTFHDFMTPTPTPQQEQTSNG